MAVAKPPEIVTDHVYLGVKLYKRDLKDVFDVFLSKQHVLKIDDSTHYYKDYNDLVDNAPSNVVSLNILSASPVEGSRDIFYDYRGVTYRLRLLNGSIITSFSGDNDLGQEIDRLISGILVRQQVNRIGFWKSAWSRPVVVWLFYLLLPTVLLYFIIYYENIRFPNYAVGGIFVFINVAYITIDRLRKVRLICVIKPGLTREESSFWLKKRGDLLYDLVKIAVGALIGSVATYLIRK